VDRADPDRLFGIVSFTNVPLQAKVHSLFGKAMQLRGYTPVVFTWASARYAREYLGMFGIDRLVTWREHVRRAGPPAAELESIVSSLLPERPTVAELIGARFHDVQVGKHALSVTCRKLITGRLDLDDPDTVALLCAQLGRAVESVVVAERLFDELPIRKLLIRDPGYIPNAELFEVALRRGIDCVIYEQGQRKGTWILKRYSPDTLSGHVFSLAPSTWDQVRAEPWTPEQDAEVERVFAGRYRADSTDDRRRLMTGKVEKSPQEVRAQLGLDPAKKTAVIFSHIAWDQAFFWGTCLFDDYEDWLYETVKFVARECPHVNWVVKLHPYNAFKLQRAGKAEESEMVLLRSLMPLPEHVRILRSTTDISTRSLFPVIDAVLTVHGTVGFEFPAHGVPAVVAGTGRYDGRGFTVEPATRDDYFRVLREIDRLPPLAPEARELARRHFLALMQRRQFSLEDVAPMELKRLNEAVSAVHDNIRFTPRTLEEFEGASSIKRLSDWLAESRDTDLLEPA